MKKFSMAIVIIVALALIGAAAYAVLVYDDNKADDNKNNNNNNQPQQDQNKTVVAPVETDNKNITLSVKYPGQGVGGYSYPTNHTYTLELAVDSNGWAGKSNIMIFGERSDGGIDTGCMSVSVNGNNIQTTKNYVEPENVLSAMIKNISISNGSSQNIPVDVTFNRVGTFTITFQAFDEKGNPVSAPLRCSGLNVPESGKIGLSVNEHSIKDVNGKKYTEVKAGVVNNTNVRVTINASDFYLVNGSKSIQADSGLSSPESRILNFSGDSSGNDKMEVDLYFDYSGSLTGYHLEYRGAYAADNAPLN